MQATSDRQPLTALWMGFLLLLACMPAPAGTVEAVGQVIAESGSVTASRSGASARALGRGADVYPGDVIRTGWNGRVQVRFVDGGLLALSPRSRFEVAEYRAGEDGGSVIMRLFRGALRTITGAIGGAGDSYRLHTPVATLGVRGTAYQLRYCGARCVARGGQAGLYGRVDAGAVEVMAPGGHSVFGIGTYFHVADGGAPRRIVAPPRGLLSGEEGGRGRPEAAPDREIPMHRARVVDADREAFERGRIPWGTGRRGFEEAEGSRERLSRRLPRDPGPRAVREPEPAPDPAPVPAPEPEPEPAPQPEPAYQRPGTAADSTLLAVATAAPDAPAAVSAATTLYDTGSEGELRVDDANPALPVGAVLVGGAADSFVDLGRMTAESRQTLEIGEGASAFTVHTGRLGGPMGLQDGDALAEVGHASVVYAHTDAGNLTEVFPGDWRQRYTEIRGPGGTDLDGNPWALRTFDLTVGRVEGDAARLDELTLGAVGQDRSLAFVEAPDSALGTLTIDGGGSVAFDGLTSSGGTHEAKLRGRFVGPDAEALVVRFDVTGDDDITGIHVIEQYHYRRPGSPEENLLFAGAVIGDNGEFRRTDLYPSAEFGEVRLDGDGFAGAVFADGVPDRFVDASSMQVAEGGTTEISPPQDEAFEIAWGRLDGVIRSVSGNEVLDQFEGGLAYAYVDDKRLTPGDFFDDMFVRAYGNPTGPAAVDHTGAPWAVDALELVVDRRLDATRLNAFRMSAGQSTVLLADADNRVDGIFDTNGPKVLFTNRSSPDDRYRFDLQGKFVGPDADALVVRFEVSGKDREIVGIQVLEGE